jgi:hypothetical protein
VDLPAVGTEHRDQLAGMHLQIELTQRGRGTVAGGRNRCAASRNSSGLDRPFGIGASRDAEDAPDVGDIVDVGDARR